MLFKRAELLLLTLSQIIQPKGLKFGSVGSNNNGSYHGNCQATLNIAAMICLVCNALETGMSSKGKKFMESIELFRLVKTGGTAGS